MPVATAAYAGMMGNFVYLSFREKWEPDVVYLESQMGAAYLDNRRQLTKYNFILRDLESRAFIAKVVKEMQQ